LARVRRLRSPVNRASGALVWMLASVRDRRSVARRRHGCRTSASRCSQARLSGPSGPTSPSLTG